MNEIIKKILLFFGLLIFSISAVSCELDVPEWGNEYNFKIDFEESYDPNNDVKLTISLGLSSGFDLADSEIQLAYSKNRFSKINDDNVNVLFSITKFTKDDYYYTIKGKKIIYNFSEEIVIDKENFLDGQGEITFVMYHRGSHSWQSSIGKEYLYKLEDSRLVFYNRYR